ncbi:TPA_asm: L [Mango betacytorhabdovirus 1]|nr:TPA_asm: L [Mango betacytorhabdovirus 1]
MSILDSFSFEEEFGNSGLHGLGDFHLRSAITRVDLKRLSEGKGRARELKDFKHFSEVYHNNTLISGDPVKLLTKFLNEGYGLNAEHVYNDLVQKGTDVAIRRIISELNRDLDHHGDTFGRERLLNSIREHEHLLTGYSTLRGILEELILSFVAMSSKRETGGFDEDTLPLPRQDDQSCEVRINELNLIIRHGSELIAVVHTGNENQNRRFVELYSGDVLRMIADKITERDIILRASRIGNKYSPPIYPPEETILKILDWGDQILLRYQNSGYKILKAYESLVIGFLLKLEGTSIVNSADFWRNTVDGILEEFPGFQPYCDALEEILKGCSSTHWITQLFGLYRIWGHPTIDCLKGMEKTRLLGSAEKDISAEAANDAGRAFKKIFFLEYRGKNHEYPPRSFQCENPETSYIIRSIENNTEISPSHIEYCHADWDLVSLEKTFTIPKTFNLSLIIADTAISPTKDILIGVAKGSKTLMDPFKRRGVLFWMSTDPINCEELLSNINDGILDPNDLVMGQYPKERELGIVARMFTLMTATIRNYVVITEAMLSDDILPYFKQITMTDTLLDLMKKIFSGSRGQKTGSLGEKVGNSTRKVTVCINVDFEKWNLNFRKEATYHVFQQLGKLYGLENLFNRTYDIFYHSYVYLSDGSWTPEINQEGILRTDIPQAFTGHKGGFEGLRQKGWTIFTNSVIEDVCQRHKISHKVMGQGDNQVILVTFFTSQLDPSGEITTEGIVKIKMELKAFEDDLYHTFLKLGLPIKKLETWKSENFFIYGKYPVYKGVPHAMSLKKLCRASPFSNDDTMTLDNMLATIFSNAQAAAMSDVDHFLPYSLALIEGYRGVKLFSMYHPLIGRSPWRDNMQEGSVLSIKWKLGGNREKGTKPQIFSCKALLTFDEICEIILLIPKSLGGSNGITEYEFNMRGFPDNQSRDYSYLLSLIPFLVGVLKTAAMSWANLIFNPECNYESLIEDPTGINLLMPMSPLSIMRNYVRKQVAGLPEMTNHLVKGLFNFADNHVRDQYIEKLTLGDKLYTRVLHDLYGATLFGYVDGILAKIDKTVTAQRIALTRGRNDIMSRIGVGEANFWRYLYWRSLQDMIDEDMLLDCPTNIVREARNISWKKEILGVTVPYPAHVLRISKCNPITPLSANCPNANFISVQVSDAIPLGNEKAYQTLGNSPPYLGSVTREKTGLHTKLTIYGTEPLLKRPVNLLRLINWIFPEDSITADLIKELSRAVTDLDLDNFVISSDFSSGTADHRYRDYALKHGALSANLYIFHSWIHMSTDTLTDYSKGGKDYTIHFQSILCWVQQMISCMVKYQLDDIGRALDRSYHAHMCCRECIVPVEDQIPDLLDYSILDNVPTAPDNAYLYTPSDQVRTRKIGTFSDFTTPVKLTSTQLERGSQRSKRRLLTEAIRDRIFRDLNSKDDLDVQALSTGIMDVKEYPRVLFLKLSVRELLESLSRKLFLNEEILIRNNWTSVAPNEQIVRRRVIKRLGVISSAKFLGLAISLTWPEKYYEWAQLKIFTPPQHVPLTWSSVCTSAKHNLIDFIRGEYFYTLVPETQLILSNSLPDWKNLLKMKLIVMWERQTGPDLCLYCRAILFSLNLVGDDMDWLYYLRCSRSHTPITPERMSLALVTVECSQDKLEKMVEKFHTPQRLTKRVMKFNDAFPDHSLDLIRQDMRIDLDDTPIPMSTTEWGKVLWYNFSRCYRISAIPTVSQYRVLEAIMSCHQWLTRLSGVLVLGDGFGGSSLIAKHLLRGKIFSSTIADCSEAIPQTFVDLFLPSHAEDLESAKEIDKQYIVYGENNILAPEWNEKLSESYLSRTTEIIISEIELHHDPTQQDPNQYGVILEKLSTIPWCRAILVKVVLKTDMDVYQIGSVMHSYWNIQKLFTTPYCNQYKGEVWAFATGKKVDPIKRFLSIDSFFQLKDSVMGMRSGNTQVIPSPQYYYQINNILINQKKFLSLESQLAQWLEMADIPAFWQGSDNFTKVYYAIRSGRHPEEVRDEYSDRRKYLYHANADALSVRITALAISLLNNDEQMKNHLEIADEYQIQWISEQGQVYTNYDHKWSPVLQRDGKKRRYRRAEICKFSPLLRQIYFKKGFKTYEFMEEMVRFAYIPHHKREDLNQCLFLISRNAASTKSRLDLLPEIQ